ncbi:MAG TPA: hypothetical protein VGR26_00460 [Acidimicrobiales bacterium]|nr:hypothetical protein [Acidimicrobiales bacterium]
MACLYEESPPQAEAYDELGSNPARRLEVLRRGLNEVLNVHPASAARPDLMRTGDPESAGLGRVRYGTYPAPGKDEAQLFRGAPRPTARAAGDAPLARGSARSLPDYGACVLLQLEPEEHREPPIWSLHQSG